MNDRAYTITTDPARGLVEACLFGFWEIAQAQRFIADMREARGQVLQGGKRARILIDTRQQPTQAKDVVAALQEFAGDSASQQTRTAVIVESALLRLQAQRITASDAHRVFSDPAEARGWLLH